MIRQTRILIRSARGALRRLNPTAIVCPGLGLLYFSIPKIGSSTVKRYLLLNDFEKGRMRPEDVHMGTIHGYPFPRVDPRRPGDGGPWTRLAVVRDPFARIRSCYVDKIVRNRESGRPLHPGFARYRLLPLFPNFSLEMSFTEFLRAVNRVPDLLADGHFRSQHRFLAVDGDRVRVDRLIRLERFDEEMRSLLDELGLPVWDGGRVNRSKAGMPSPEWTDEAVDLVRRRYRRDFDLLGYPDSDPREVGRATLVGMAESKTTERSSE